MPFLLFIYLFCIGLSILQNGKMPTFLDEFLEDIFSVYQTPPHSPMQYLQNGLKCLGIHQVDDDILI